MLNSIVIGYQDQEPSQNESGASSHSCHVNYLHNH